MAAVSFTVPFAPVPWQRAGVTFTNQGPRHYTPERTRNWERTVSLIAKRAMAGQPPSAAPIALELDFCLEIPASWPAWKRAMAMKGELAATSKPDLDNFEKGVKDALTGIAWIDDSQVVQVVKRKFYAASPGVAVSIQPLPSLPAATSRKP